MDSVWLGLILAAFLALIPANIAKSKGYSQGLWWFYGWMLFIVALIHASLLPDKTVKGATPNIASDTADELIKFKELLDQGIITAEEFEIKKSQLLPQYLQK